ncbi:MAG TPA: HAD-IIIA family hydrolase [Polyangiaceae bacterium]|nr:HAD-IIIA family hydrolase [Polyangiaceae bacterium]
MNARVAILDRDGTIIDVLRDEETGAITVAFHPDHIRFLPGAIEGMRALSSAGFVLAIATNQPAPAKGQFSAAAVKRTNDALVDKLSREGIAIATVEACMHHPTGGAGGDPALVKVCDCRKPKAGMLEAIVSRLGADRASSWMLGDSSGDVQAGKAAGLKAGLVFATNRCELCPLRSGPEDHADLGTRGARLTPDAHGASLAELASAVLAGDPR